MQLPFTNGQEKQEKGTHVRQNDRQLPYLDPETLDIIFENVYRDSHKNITTAELHDLVTVLQQMQEYNYRYRTEMSWRIYPLLRDFMGLVLTSAI